MNTFHIDVRNDDDPRARTRSPLPNYHAEASLAHSSEDRHDSFHSSSQPSTTGKLTKKRPTVCSLSSSSLSYNKSLVFSTAMIGNKSGNITFLPECAPIPLLAPVDMAIPP
jgi:hypothetical protein